VLAIVLIVLLMPLVCNASDHFTDCCQSTVVEIYQFSDRGTVGGLIQCADGSQHQFSWDATGQHDVQNQQWSRKLKRAYSGADHPSKDGATLLEVGSVEEASLIAALRCWVDAVLSMEQQERILAEQRGMTLSMSPAEYDAQFDKETLRAIEALGVVTGLERQRAAAAN